MGSSICSWLSLGVCCIVRYVKIEVAAFLALGTRHISLGISAIL